MVGLRRLSRLHPVRAAGGLASLRPDRDGARRGPAGALLPALGLSARRRAVPGAVSRQVRRRAGHLPHRRRAAADGGLRFGSSGWTGRWTCRNRWAVAGGDSPAPSRITSTGPARTRSARWPTAPCAGSGPTGIPSPRPARWPGWTARPTAPTSPCRWSPAGGSGSGASRSPGNQAPSPSARSSASSPFEAGDWYDAHALEESRQQLTQMDIVRLASVDVPRDSADDSSVVVDAQPGREPGAHHQGGERVHLLGRAHLAGLLDRPELAGRPPDLHRGGAPPRRARGIGEPRAAALSGSTSPPSSPTSATGACPWPAVRSSSIAATCATGALASASRDRWSSRPRRSSPSRWATRSRTGGSTTTASAPTSRPRSTSRCSAWRTRGRSEPRRRPATGAPSRSRAATAGSIASPTRGRAT